MADLDADGKLDLISGSYWPGDLTLFRGIGPREKGAKGLAFAAGEILKDRDGKNLNAGPPWKSKDKHEMDSLAAAPWLVDWDGDGDLDLLVGNIAGRIVLLANEGTPQKADFVRKGPIEAGGKTLSVDDNDAGPTTADWDGDGRWDLIAGGGAGSVLFFRNEGTAKEPKLAAGVALVPSGGHSSVKAGQTPKRPGMRLKPHVCDWNGDGRLDLLVGDFTSVEKPAPKLTAEQEKLRDDLQKKQEEIMQRYTKLHENGDEEPSEELKKERETVMAELSKVYQELRPLLPGSDPEGWVWVYLRKAPKSL